MILVGGGFFARQYLSEQKEEVKITEQGTEDEVAQTPYIKLILPNGGEQLVVGNAYNITWDSSGIDKVDIGYRRDNDAEIMGWIGQQISASEGSYNWTVTEEVFWGDTVQQDSFQIVIGKSSFGPGLLGLNLQNGETIDSSDSDFIISRKDEIANWQTYRNEEYGFEIKYPQDWQVNNLTSEIKISKSGSFLEIVENKNDNNLTLDEWFKEETIINGRPTVKAAAKKILINGVGAYRDDSDLQPPNPLFEIVGIANPQRKIFSLYAYSGQLSDNKILETMLSTFRFFKFTEETNGWKTLYYPQYEFSITYPSSEEILTEGYVGDNATSVIAYLRTINEPEQTEGTFVILAYGLYTSFDECTQVPEILGATSSVLIGPTPFIRTDYFPYKTEYTDILELKRDYTTFRNGICYVINLEAFPSACISSGCYPDRQWSEVTFKAMLDELALIVDTFRFTSQ